MDNIFSIKKNSLLPYFQGQFDLNGRKTGVEVLIRQNHPVKGVLPPSSFLSSYENTPLISLIDLWSFRVAIAWQKRHPELNVSSNISGFSLSSKEFIEAIKNIVFTEKIDISRFTLELTEQSEIPDIAIEYSRILKDTGIKLALDDWGKEFSGSNRLLSLPIDTIKIDQHLIQNLHQKCSIEKKLESPDCKATVLTKNTILSGKEMQMAVVAEGVETQEQFNILVDLGCNNFQGYFFERPYAESELSEYSLKA